MWRQNGMGRERNGVSMGWREGKETWLGLTHTSMPLHTLAWSMLNSRHKSEKFHGRGGSFPQTKWTSVHIEETFQLPPSHKCHMCSVGAAASVGRFKLILPVNHTDLLLAHLVWPLDTQKLQSRHRFSSWVSFSFLLPFPLQHYLSWG